MRTTITADSYIDLLKQLRRVDISLPPISQGRTKVQTERWIMYRFLATFGDQSDIAYPLTVAHKDKPDFRIGLPESHVGVEVTSAMPEEYARARVLRDKFCPNAPIELDYFRWGGPKRTSKEILEILRQSEKRLTGMPWIGDSVEREWSAAISSAVEAKTDSLNSSGFKRHPANWLLIYDDVPQFALDLQLAVKHLLDRLNDLPSRRQKSAIAFSKLFVETRNRFITVENGNWSQTKVRNIWRKRSG